MQAERARIPRADVNLLKIPEGIEDERALMVGDVLTTSYFGSVVVDPAPGETVAIVGAGPVGSFCAKTTAIRALAACWRSTPCPSGWMRRPRPAARVVAGRGRPSGARDHGGPRR